MYYMKTIIEMTEPQVAAGQELLDKPGTCICGSPMTYRRGIIGQPRVKSGLMDLVVLCLICHAKVQGVLESLIGSYKNPEEINLDAPQP